MKMHVFVEQQSCAHEKLAKSSLPMPNYLFCYGLLLQDFGTPGPDNPVPLWGLISIHVSAYPATAVSWCLL